MNFKVDENLPADVLELLRADGHHAHGVHEEHLSGRSDADIIAAATAEARVLISLDLDFADIRSYPPQRHTGVMILRLHRQDKEAVLRAIRSLLPLLGQEELVGRLWIVSEADVRIYGEK